MAKERVQDLTNGEPMRLIIGFALPLLGGMLFQQVYTIVDTMIVGRTLGVNALAGVGSTGSVNFMVVGFCMGVCSGFSIPVSQYFGAKDYVRMRQTAAHAIILAALFAVVMTIAVSLLTAPILRLMNTPEDVFSYAYNYILVIFLGIPAVYLYNLISGLIRALGDTKAPLVFLVIASVLNIGLDLFFILVLHLGVFGAALATVLSQLASGIVSAVYMVKKISVMRIARNEWAWDARIAKKVFSMGVPMGLQYSITAIGSVMLQTAVNGLGSMYVAAMTAGGRVAFFFCCVFDALGSTMATYGGQNVGAGKVDRLNAGLKSASIIGVTYAVAVFAVLLVNGRFFAGLFVTGGAEEIVGYAHRLLIIMSAFYIPLLYVNVVRFMIQGMGYPGIAMLAGVAEMIARGAVALVLIPLFGFAGACFASPVAWIAADAFLFPAYFKLRKKTIRLLQKESGP